MTALLVEPTTAAQRPHRRVPRVPRDLWPALVVCLAGCAVLALAVARSPHDLNNVDGISYISIARQYADGHFGSAVNAYWSPLVSWLAAPLIHWGVDGVVAVVAASAASAVVGLAAGVALVWRVSGRHGVATAVAALVTAVFYVGNVRMLTPDVMVVAWSSCFVYALHRLDEARSDRRAAARWAVVLGVVCAVGYVTKLFLVPVIVVSLAIWAGVRLVRAHDGTARRRVLAAACLTALVTVVVSAPWVAALSLKYGEPTIGSSFGVNMTAKFDPQQVSLLPTADTPLWAPPNEHAVSFGEDRSFQVGDGVPTPSEPLGERLRYYLEQRMLALPHYLEMIRSIAPWALPTMVVATGALVLRRGGGTLRAPLFVLTVVFWVYFLGYAGVTTAARGGGNARYYWPLLTLSALAACCALPGVWARLTAAGGRARRAVAVAVVACLPLTAVWQHGMGHSAPFSIVSSTHGIGYLLDPPQVPHLERVADELSTTVAPGSRLVGSNYRATLRLAYYLEAQVYGRAEQGYDVADPAFRAKMADAGIEYYVAFTPVAAGTPDLGDLGRVVHTLTASITCSDLARAVVEDCRVDVVELHDGSR